MVPLQTKVSEGILEVQYRREASCSNREFKESRTQEFETGGSYVFQREGAKTRRRREEELT